MIAVEHRLSWLHTAFIYILKVLQPINNVVFYSGMRGIERYESYAQASTIYCLLFVMPASIPSACCLLLSASVSAPVSVPKVCGSFVVVCGVGPWVSVDRCSAV
jgi:hypothetical protein